MNTQKLILGTLIGFVVMFLVGWGIWGILIEPMSADYFTQHVGLKKDPPDVGLIAASCFTSAFLMTIIFHRWAGIKTFVTGAKAGAIIACLMGLTSSLMMVATLNYAGWQVIFFDLIGNVLWGGISGGVIGWFLGSRNNTNS